MSAPCNCQKPAIVVLESMTHKMTGQQIIPRICIFFQDQNYKEPPHIRKCNFEYLMFKAGKHLLKYGTYLQFYT